MKSLFSKLLLTFSISLIAMITSFILSYKYLSESPRHEFFLSNVRNYGDLLIDEYKQNPLSSKLRLEKSNLNIREFDLHGVDAFLDKEFPNVKFFKEDNGLWLARDPNLFIMKFSQGKRSYLIYADKGRISNGLLPLVVAIVISSLVLLITYYRVRKMFLPLQQVSEGARVFATGDFSHRIPDDGKKEFTTLIQQVNEMASKIQSMLETRKDLFLAIAHELKTPLASARLYTELLPEEESQQKIIKEIKYLDKLISKLIEIEKDSDLKPIEKEEIQVIELTKELKGVEIIQEVQSIQGDLFLFKLVLSNLVQNAKDHGGEEIQVIFSPTSIAVVDNGQGVPDEKMPHLTEPFYQVDATRSRQVKGFGLGLYLVSKIVERMGLRLALENTQKGFAATLYLTQE